MDFNTNEMRFIEQDASSFLSAVRLRRGERARLNSQSVLIIVDLQEDFAGERPLAVENAEAVAEANHGLARRAIAAGLAVVVTRDWHPEDHFSFKIWPRHCVVGSDGARFIPQLDYPDLERDIRLANIGLDNHTPDYNPYYDPALQTFMSDRAPDRIYVTGIALEYCVLATCLSSKAYSDNVIALEDYICSANADHGRFAWNLLSRAGVVRMRGSPFH